MPSSRYLSHTVFGRCSHPAKLRTASTLVGRSGRLYFQGEALQRHREDPQRSIFKAQSGDESFVLKRVPKPFYDLSLRLATDVAGSSRLRMHTDCNEDEGILFYPYFRDTLLALIQRDPDLPEIERNRILRRVAEAIEELHSKDWVHADIKPDNILVNWTCDSSGKKKITDVVLGDFDIAFKSEGGQPRQTPYAVGNVIWRSPEGQTGKGVTKASDIFSFGLVCIYTLGGGAFLLLEDFQELAQSGTRPEQEILTRHFAYFGLLPEGLLKKVDSEKWGMALKGASRIAEQLVKEQPELRFAWWGKELGHDGLSTISGMTNPDPRSRTEISQVLASSWWR